MDVVGGGKSIAHNLVERALICAIAINFATFEEWQKFTPFPFTEASVNLDVEFVRIKRTRYKVNTGAFIHIIVSYISCCLAD